MIKYNNYDPLSQIPKKNFKKNDFSMADLHEETNIYFLIHFNTINVKLKKIEELVNKVVKKFKA